MSKMLHFIASEVLNKPLLCEAGYAEHMLDFLGPRIGVDNSSMSAGSFNAREQSFEAATGVAVIPVIGSLSHRATWLEAECGMRSYEGIARDLDAAMENDDVEVILAEYDTPGGAVSGAFDLADKFHEASKRKKVIAYVNDLAASAGYLQASQANMIFTSQTGMVGSIGVVMAHVDRSKQLEAQGVKPTFIYAGKRKIDGNSAIPLSSEAKDRFQASVDEAYDMFVAAVVRGRAMSDEAVRATEAGVFGAKEARSLGLIDGVMNKESMMQFAMNEAAALRQNRRLYAR